MARHSRYSQAGSPVAPPAFVVGGGVNALAVVRSLGRKRIPVSVFSSDPKDLVRGSRYVSFFHHVSEDPKELVRALLEICQKDNCRPVLFFTADKHLKFVSTYRDRLKGSFRFIVADETAVSSVLSKGEFNRFTEDTGFPAPRGLVVSRHAQPLDNIESLHYPVVVKPLLSYEWRSRAFVETFGITKAMRFDAPAKLSRTLRDLLEFSSELLIQELILGPDDAHYSVLIYRSPRLGELFRLCVNKQRVWPIRNGAGSYMKIAPDSHMERIAGELLDKLKWVGMASVCFKIDSRTGEPMIHEVNGRLPQIHGIAQAAGVDLPYLMYLDVLEADLPTIPRPSYSATYRIFSMDCAGLRAYRRAGELTRLGVLKRFLQGDSIAEFAWDDPVPFLRLFPRELSNIIRGLR